METTSETTYAATRVPVYDKGTQGPKPIASGDLGLSIERTKSYCADRGGRAVAAGGGDGGELLGAWQDAEGMRPGRPDSGDGAGGGNHGVRVDGYTAPVTRSPLDPWHSEEYLVACLVKTHGWTWDEPRLLRGPWRGRKAVKCFMNPEGVTQ